MVLSHSSFLVLSSRWGTSPQPACTRYREEEISGTVPGLLRSTHGAIAGALRGLDVGETDMVDRDGVHVLFHGRDAVPFLVVEALLDPALPALALGDRLLFGFLAHDALGRILHDADLQRAGGGVQVGVG